MRRIVLILCALAPTAAFAWKDSCAYSVERVSGADATGVEKVVIHAGDGDIKVIGHAAVTRLEARGKACAWSQPQLAVTTLSVRREGKVIYVVTTQSGDDRSLARSNQESYMDLEIALPAGVAVEALDSDGDATFEDLHALTLQKKYGHLVLRRIAGTADIVNGSGDLVIEDAGSASVRGGSGNIEIRKVRGDVTVEQDGAGEVHVAVVGGDFTLRPGKTLRVEYKSIQGKVSLPKPVRN